MRRILCFGHLPVLRGHLGFPCLLSDHLSCPSGLQAHSLSKKPKQNTVLKRIPGVQHGTHSSCTSCAFRSIMLKNKLTKCLEEWLHKAGAISVHCRVHVDVICSYNRRQVKKKHTYFLFGMKNIRLGSNLEASSLPKIIILKSVFSPFVQCVKMLLKTQTPLDPDLMAASAAGVSTQRSSSPVWRSWGSPGPASSAVHSLHSTTAPLLYREEG